MSTKTPHTRCMTCGAWGPPGRYHPHAFCVLVAHYRGDVSAARMALDAVLDFGRKLERFKLPNDTSIGRVWLAEEDAVKRPQPRRKG